MLFKRSSSSSAVTEAPWEPTGNTPLMALRGIEKSFPVGAGQTFVLRRITLDIKHAVVDKRIPRKSLSRLSEECR